MLIDRIMGIAALVSVAAFLSVLVVEVPEPALIIVIVGVMVMAAWDFWLSLKPRRREPPR